MSIVCSGVSVRWPDGTTVLDRLDATFDEARTGLIGLNGSGKSTLLRLVAGRLTPTTGTVSVDGEVGYLAQDLALHESRTVSDLLGITGTLRALRAIERGDASADNLATVGDDWDVEERSHGHLRKLGWRNAGDDLLDRTVDTLSGGEAVQAALAGLLLRRPDVTLLDEPTNNLDRRARERLRDAVRQWPGSLVVVSHDRELLDELDRIVELREGGVRTFGGNYSEYLDQLRAEQKSARRMVRSAEADVRREKRQLAEARTKLDRRARYGAKMTAQKREPKVVMNQRKRDAEVSAGKHRIMQEDKLGEARRALSDAEDAVRDDDRIRITLPRTEVPAGRTVLELRHPGGDLSIRGPERVAVLGANGSGKTTLLRDIVGDGDRARGPSTVTRGVSEIAYLPQRLNVLDENRSVLDTMRQAAPSATTNQIRAGLARFLVHSDRAERLIGALSGGERFRVTLACLLLADRAPQLFVLDEPTNNLDLASVTALTDALGRYRGALLVASHDLWFLREIGIDRWWSLDHGHAPVDAGAP